VKRSRIDGAIDAMAAIAFAGVAWLAVFGHRGLAPCAGFLALGVAMRREVWTEGLKLIAPPKAWRDPLAIAAIAMAAFSAWIGVTALWSPTPGGIWLGLTALVSALAAGALVFEASRANTIRSRRFAAMFALSVTAASLALLFEGLTGGYLRAVLPPDDHSALRFKDLTALGRGVTAAATLAFPAAVLLRALTGSWIIAFAPAAALLVAATEFSVFANVIAIAAGALAFFAAHAAPKTTIKGAAVLFLAGLLLSPFIAAAIPVDCLLEAGALPPSWSQRLILWNAVADRALGECFPLGCGADFARTWWSATAMIELPGYPIALPLVPVHPHNVFLQIWLELGVPGVLLFGVALSAGAARLAAADLDRSTIAATAAIAALAFISVMFEASLWQVWRIAVFALAAFGGAVSYSINKSKQ
jgi:hypothetical protein